MMLGVKTPSATDKGLSLKIQGCPTISHIDIELDRGTDTYTVLFRKVKIRPEFSVKNVKTSEGIFADNLVTVIEETTGLYLSL